MDPRPTKCDLNFCMHKYDRVDVKNGGRGEMVGILIRRRKPGRSEEEEEMVSEKEEMIKTEEVRCYFESMAPIRPPKPSRSEPTSMHPPLSPPFSAQIPELLKLNSLSSSSPPMLRGGGGAEAEEFVETEYYRHIDSIDKQHHRTGTGFINASEEEGLGLGLRSEEWIHGGRSTAFRGNPARNEWIPLEDEIQNRSEG